MNKLKENLKFILTAFLIFSMIVICAFYFKSYRKYDNLYYSNISRDLIMINSNCSSLKQEIEQIITDKNATQDQIINIQRLAFDVENKYNNISFNNSNYAEYDDYTNPKAKYEPFKKSNEYITSLLDSRLYKNNIIIINDKEADTLSNLSEFYSEVLKTLKPYVNNGDVKPEVVSSDKWIDILDHIIKISNVYENYV
jgi:vacuolar-type H+-ATPase catalytic subunit A/Vma1